MFQRVSAKLGNMRKPQSFSVMTTSGGQLMVQSEKSIGQFDPATGKGRLSVKGNDFISLSLRGTPFEFPEDFRAACVAAVAKQGDKVDLGGVIVNTVIREV